MLVTRYYLAFLKGDQAGMEREIARAPAEHAEDWMSHNQALVLARSGRMREARTLWARAVALSQQDGRRETAALYEAAQAVCEAHFENAAAARTWARSALDLAKGRDVEYAAAFALALSGDSAGPQRLADDLAKRFPEDTPVQFEYLPTLRALSAISRKAPLDAIERLETALPYDLAMPGTAFFAKFGGLYTAYVRGQGYLQAGRGREAASEFQKILDHRGIVLADPVSALAHLQLGRAYVVSGDRPKPKAPTRTSSRSGRMPTRTSRSSKRQGRNTRSYSYFPPLFNLWGMSELPPNCKGWQPLHDQPAGSCIVRHSEPAKSKVRAGRFGMSRL